MNKCINSFNNAGKFLSIENDNFSVRCSQSIVFLPLSSHAIVDLILDAILKACQRFLHEILFLSVGVEIFAWFALFRFRTLNFDNHHDVVKVVRHFLVSSTSNLFHEVLQEWNTDLSWNIDESFVDQESSSAIIAAENITKKLHSCIGCMFISSVEDYRFDLLNAFRVLSAGQIDHRCDSKNNFLIVILILTHLLIPALLDDRSNIVLADDNLRQLGKIDVSLQEQLTEQQFDAIEI
jgi:hypothetical protein